MALEMIALDKHWAQEIEDVVEVIAHTLARENASTRILRGLNFQHSGIVVVPDGGDVWRWMLTRAQSGRRAPMTRASALLTLLA